MKDTDVRQGTLALMVLKTLEVLSPLHGYGIARRIEQINNHNINESIIKDQKSTIK
jgi:PadR family transcriptional regulator, regulatory protein PadR